ncbi:MAG: hypothetical protein KAX57_00820 [Rhodoferax sp.]|nr:hypothetical protein [Rhodoferax sp.]MBP9147932.1 hypothetical protein [Rhodoferax sp.]
MINYCISHKPLMFRNNSQLRHILLGDELLPKKEQFLPSESIHHISEIAQDLDYLHCMLAGSSGTFAIARLLRGTHDEWDETTSVVINQYRKFMAKDTLGMKSINYPGMVMVPVDKAIDIDVFEIQANIKTPFLLPSPIVVGNTYNQYCTAHRGQDFLRYIAIAIDLGIIDHKQAGQIFNSEMMIPGGVEFGIYPVAIFLDVVEKLEKICLEFAKNNLPSSLDRYQRRALAFCNERMGSYLLLLTLNQICGAEISPEWFGYMHTVSDNLTYYGT